MRRIGREGRGVIVLIRDVRHGVIGERLNEMASGGAADDDPGEKRLLDYGIGAQILVDLGVQNMVLLSNSPTPRIVGLDGYNLNIVARRPLDEK